MNRLTALLALFISIIVLPACEQEESETVQASEYVDGSRELSERAAFTADLWSESGAVEAGSNNIVLRVAFPDAGDPMKGEGQGIPNANIELDAWMPNGDIDMTSTPKVSYLGDGEYRFEGVQLPESGVWSLNFRIAVGQTVTEEVEFTFSI